LLGAAAVDPERLLWVPGKRLISIPRVSILEVPPLFQLLGSGGIAAGEFRRWTHTDLRAIKRGKSKLARKVGDILWNKQLL
jgi:hypothetical protein